MKKEKTCKDEGCCCEKVFAGLKNQFKVKAKDAQKYAKKNPQKTKTILASLGAGLMVVIAFFIGKNKNKNQDIDLD